MMNENMENLEKFLRRSEEKYRIAIDAFKNRDARYSGRHREVLDFITLRGRGMVFNFDYYFFVKFNSGMEYVAYILEEYSDIKTYFDCRSKVFLDAIAELEEIHCELINSLGQWFISEEDSFSSKHYLDQIQILNRYKEEVLEREFDAINMIQKLGNRQHNIKDDINKLFLDLAIIEHEIAICNEVLYNVFEIE